MLSARDRLSARFRYGAMLSGGGPASAEASLPYSPQIASSPGSCAGIGQRSKGCQRSTKSPDSTAHMLRPFTMRMS